MSWSVNALGNPAKVKEALASQFESAKKSSAWLAEEQASVGAVEGLVNLALDFAVVSGLKVVRVEACGSASKQNGTWPGSISVSLKVEPIHGFVE